MAFTAKPHHHKNAKAVIGLLIVLLAFAIFMIFFTNRDNIESSSMFQPFMVLTVLELGLLAGLFYLVNNSLKVVKAHSVSKKSSGSSKKKKRSR